MQQTVAGLEQVEMVWQPGEDVTSHAGEPVPPQSDFFTAPPPEIGKVVTAQTTLVRGKQPKTWTRRMVYALIAFAVLALPFRFLLAPKVHPEERQVVTIVSSAAGFIAALIVLAATGFRHVATFVGEQGLARCTIRGGRTVRPRVELLEFAQADSLFTTSVRQYVNGVYSGTTYKHVWKDRSGRKLYQLNGTYRAGKTELPKPTHPYHFANSGEIAWSNFLLARLQADLEKNGYVEFPISARNQVRMSPGCIDFVINGELQRLTHEDIGDIRADNGVIYFRHKDARWFSGKGKFHFAYGTIPNAMCFLLCMDRLLGYRLG